jgi:hypothetical protein
MASPERSYTERLAGVSNTFDVGMFLLGALTGNGALLILSVASFAGGKKVESFAKDRRQQGKWIP